MTKLVALAIVLAAAPAAADPCDVRIVHAPEDVRAEVAKWLVEEAACGGPLEVRIVPTTDGLYVFARDASGLVRERTVPDAVSAGVLIASWAAADAETAKPALDVELTYVPPVAEPALSPPRDTAVRRHHVVARSREDRTLAMQTIYGGTLRGVRGEYDLWRSGPFVLSGTMSLSQDRYTDWENRGHDELDFLDGRALAMFAAVGESGPLRLSWSGGAGVIGSYARGTSYFDDDPMHPSYAYGTLDVLAFTPAFEASAALGVRLSPQWLVEAGALGTLFVAEYEVPTRMGHTTIEARGVRLQFLAGVRRSL